LAVSFSPPLRQEPVNQLLFLNSEVSSKLSGISKEYLKFRNLINSLNLIFLGVAPQEVYHELNL